MIEEKIAPAVEEVPAPAVEEVPAPVVEEVPAPVTEEVPVADAAPVVEEVIVPAVETAPVMEENIAAEVEEVVPEIEETVFISDTPFPPIEKTDEKKESTIGGSGRRSVANDEPMALKKAVENPVVAEVVDLFSGTVIDVHR